MFLLVYIILNYGTVVSLIIIFVQDSNLDYSDNVASLEEYYSSSISMSSENSADVHSASTILTSDLSSKSGISVISDFSSNPSSPSRANSNISVNSNASTSTSSTLSSDAAISVSSNASTCSNFDNPEDERFRTEWLFEPLYEGTTTLNGDVLRQVLDIHITGAATKQVLDKTLKLIETVIPAGTNNFPKTRYFLLKTIKNLMPHSFSESVIRHIGRWDTVPPDTVCNICLNPDLNGLVLQFSIRSAIQEAFEVGNLHRYIDDFEEERNMKQRENIIYDITSGDEFKRLKDTVIHEKYDLCLMWNADGVPTDGDTGHMWTLQAQILNVRPRCRRRFQILCGLYYSNTKSKKNPGMFSFLKPFVEETQDLFMEKVEWIHKETGRYMKSLVIAPVDNLDAPARAAAENIMQYNGKFGCSICEHPGQTCQTGRGFNHVYPSDKQDYPLRTKKGF